MTLSRTLPAIAIGFVVATVAFAAQTAAPDGPVGCRNHGMMAALTPDERLMFMVEMHKDTAGLPKDQRRDYLKAQRQKLRDMSAAEKQAFAAGLEAKWNALPAEAKSRIRERVEALKSSHPLMARRIDGGC